MEAIFASILIGVLIVGPLTWRARVDRNHVRAEAIRAEMLAAVNRRLGGQSLLAVDVVPRTLWRAGRVVLSTPGGYEGLTQAVMPLVLKRMPAGYELVVHAGQARATAPQGRQLPRAA